MSFPILYHWSSITLTTKRLSTYLLEDSLPTLIILTPKQKIVKTINDLFLPFIKGLTRSFCFWEDRKYFLEKWMTTRILALTISFISDDTNKWIIESQERCSKDMLYFLFCWIPVLWTKIWLTNNLTFLDSFWVSPRVELTKPHIWLGTLKNQWYIVFPYLVLFDIEVKI